MNLIDKCARRKKELNKKSKMDQQTFKKKVS